MILLCDADIGTGVPKALKLVNREARSLHDMGWLAKEDAWWLPRAGQLEYLVFSANKRMLQVASERRAIIDGSVGIVYLTTGEEFVWDVLALLLRKWGTLETLFDTTPRPFARFLSPRGRLTDRYRRLRL